MNKSRTKLNPWPVAIISFFVMAIAFIVSFIVFASGQRADLVRQDYYEEEIRFQHQIDRVSRTESISAQVGIAYDSAGRFIAVTLPALQADQQPTGRILLYRPSDARLDQSIRLALDPTGVQRLDAKRLRSGLWKIRVQWNVSGQEFFFDKSIVVNSAES